MAGTWWEGPQSAQQRRREERAQGWPSQCEGAGDSMEGVGVCVTEGRSWEQGHSTAPNLEAPLSTALDGQGQGRGVRGRVCRGVGVRQLDAPAAMRSCFQVRSLSATWRGFSLVPTLWLF